MQRLEVCHSTVYRYRRPVAFGEHRLMFRPRDSHDLRLVETGLTISPPAKVRWLHDVLSNSIAIATFETPSDRLSFESRILLDHFGLSTPNFAIEDYAQVFPFSYPNEELPDLRRFIESGHPDPERRVLRWARRFLSGGTTDTGKLLLDMTQAIANGFAYRRRYAIGTQPPAETLARGEGTCRDFALLMMEGLRALGLAARFVSGYLYDPAVDGAGPGAVGAGETHAWVQVYLPGAGWVEYDPTNGLAGGANLIRVAVARDPSLAIPLQGSYLGAPDDFLDMEVDVQVTAVPWDKAA